MNPIYLNEVVNYKPPRPTSYASGQRKAKVEQVQMISSLPTFWPELILSTIAACGGVFTSLIGWSGILLNNRSFLAWSRDLQTPYIQPRSPFVEATISQTCYARSILPGCKGPYLVFERKLLALWIKAVFWFGKGMMPEAYRLDITTMAVIMDNYANQFAEQYGADIASNVLKSTPSKSVLGNNTINASTSLDSPQHDIPMDPFKTKHMGTPRAF
ncbi:hypothetical protein BYT27DRAFT_7207544 [Phlegmacium glaucopus]|nr:hypothetical protein BYT27DRAFT_7207544 [Phlegmacium glaucopus]